MGLHPSGDRTEFAVGDRDQRIGPAVVDRAALLAHQAVPVQSRAAIAPPNLIVGGGAARAGRYDASRDPAQRLFVRLFVRLILLCHTRSLAVASDTSKEYACQ